MRKFPLLRAPVSTGRLLVCPFRNPAAIDKELLIWNAHVPEQEGGGLAVVAIAAVAINHDLLRLLADRQDGVEIFFRMVRIELVSAGNVALLVMFFVAGVNENNDVLLKARIVKQPAPPGGPSSNCNPFSFICAARNCAGERASEFVPVAAGDPSPATGRTEWAVPAGK